MFVVGGLKIYQNRCVCNQILFHDFRIARVRSPVKIEPNICTQFVMQIKFRGSIYIPSAKDAMSFWLIVMCRYDGQSSDSPSRGSKRTSRHTRAANSSSITEPECAVRVEVCVSGGGGGGEEDV